MCNIVKPNCNHFLKFRLNFFDFAHGEDAHGAFNALFHHGAGHLIGFVDVPVEVIVVRIAPARADELRKKVPALLAREETALRELRPYLGVQFALKDVAHLPFFFARELVAGIDVAVRDDGEILVPRAAGGDALFKAGSPLEVDVEVEEIESFPLLFPLDVLVAEDFVLLRDLREMFLFDLEVGDVRDDGLHREGIESLVGEEEHVLGKVEVLGREGACPLSRGRTS